MLINGLLILFGFVMLIKGADYLIEGAVSLAERAGLSLFLVGITIVAFGTSAPELFVSLIGAVNNSTGISIGNIIGSNISNIGLVLGLALIVSKAAFDVEKDNGLYLKKGLIMVLVMLVFHLLARDGYLSRLDGSILIILFVMFIAYLIITHDSSVSEEEVERPFSWLSTIQILGGILFLFLGGRVLVTSSVAIARLLSISEFIIGVTIVAVGTSLPELAASIVAALKNKASISIANIIGSNIFNVLLVIGVVSIIHPIKFSYDIVAGSFYVNTLIAIFFTGILLMSKKLDKATGVVLLFSYSGYLIFLFI
jgi:cation:H+ antiporter